jgi:hypothetical protein
MAHDYEDHSDQIRGIRMGRRQFQAGCAPKAVSSPRPLYTLTLADGVVWGEYRNRAGAERAQALRGGTISERIV